MRQTQDRGDRAPKQKSDIDGATEDTDRLNASSVDQVAPCRRSSHAASPSHRPSLIIRCPLDTPEAAPVRLRVIATIASLSEQIAHHSDPTLKLGFKIVIRPTRHYSVIDVLD